MLRKATPTALTALALALLVAGAVPAVAKDRKVTLDLEDAEGDGISLTLSGRWLEEAVLDSIGESIDCDGTDDRQTRRMLEHLRAEGEGSSYTMRDGDETTRARRRNGKLELRKYEKGEAPTRVVMPWAMGECMLGNPVPMRKLGDGFEMRIEKDGELSLTID